jgi:hypothetical protein
MLLEQMFFEQKLLQQTVLDDISFEQMLLVKMTLKQTLNKCC